MIDQIEKQSGKIVKKTRALYYFDERNNTSFHEYVDHK